uniref:Protein vav-1 n=1 Tax=Ascaris lumbricoides TaxID=6252 RepID=A0A9J2PEQ3_ASCLU
MIVELRWCIVDYNNGIRLETFMGDGTELWRECVGWLIECGVLDATHRVAEPDAEIGEFAQLLRDGVLLCVLCNRLCENCIDTKELQQRPQMAQFLCCKNICEFLKACQNTFEMKPDDLFDPWDLYRLNDFGKVLTTLSKLSNSAHAKLIGYRGFPVKPISQSSVEYYNDEAIYRHLRDDAEAQEPVIENAYSLGAVQEEEKTSGQIYDTIVCQRSNSQREIKFAESDKWLSFKPETKRDHCIKELYDTETNYVEKALNMIINKFYTPLQDVLQPEDHKLIFMNIVELACIHQSFRDHLRQAVLYTVGLETPPKNTRVMTIGDVFKSWKGKFVAYGDYCSQLPESRSRICQLEKTNPLIRQKIIECGIAANRNQFHLQDLLSIPMQRVLKYHVLLSEMIKLTSVESSDRIPLEEAKEAMQDINSYVNEVKRDHEMQQLVAAIEKNGEIKIADHSKDGSKLKNRYVFVFDKVMFVCKSLKNNQYSFKSAHLLRDYRVEIDFDNGNKFGTITRKLTTNGGHYFSLVEERGDSVNNVIAMCCKTLTQRDCWVQTIEQAQDNDSPKDAAASSHVLRYYSYAKPTLCSHCQKLLAGLFFQGYQCSVCKKNLHRACISMNKCNGNALPQTHNTMPHRRKHFSSFRPNECVRAVQSFRSTDPRYLSFEKNDLIELTQVNADGTLLGRIAAFPERSGLIQAEFVRKYRLSTTSLHNSFNAGTAGSVLNGSGGPLTPLERPDSLGSPLLPKPASVSQQRASTLSQETMMTTRTPPGQDYINTDIMGQEWYQGSLERREAENRLRGTPDGTFLVRFSNTQQKYVVSISFCGDVKHTKVEQSIDNKVYLDESTMFSSVVELINYYREHNLRESFETLNTTLRQPYVVNRPYVAIHNFEATDPNFLELVVGQKVYVISRTGEERGWWKGRTGNRVGSFIFSF